MITEPDRMLDRALAYARRGWPVFPCRPGAKEPATRHGFRDASTDPDRIRSWWHRQPDANIAIATGLPGPDVLDVDQHGPAGNGFTACRHLQAAGLLDGHSAIIATPGGGLHLYFRGSTQASGRLPRHHLDFRSAGGYVLAPPSQTGGTRYRLVRSGWRPGCLDWAAVTGLLAPRRDSPCSHRGANSADAGRLAAWVEQLQEGNRNCGLFWAACRLVEAGRPEVLSELAEAAARTGLPEREIARTITSAQRSAQPAGRRQPARKHGGRA
jgi:hypothetical protein